MKKKMCATCSEEKILENFSKDSTTPDGHEYSCKLCRSNARKRVLRGKKKIYATPLWGLNEQELSNYVSANCEICCLTFYPINKRNTTCPSCQETTEKVYHAISASSGWNNDYRRHKVAHTDLVGITKKYIATVVCPYCGRGFTESNPKSLDHIEPKSVGGTNDHTNINICCLECNRCRGKLSLNEWFDLCSSITRYQASVGSSSREGSGES